ncbi:hypothetical protein [Capnocytophaga leadbetteri]|uniref:hypothetical protein n=1 Tax=Capnocytophaga leadbetteri TaxID=327575 RepID=UPI00288AC41C|nr:hypothetical protein [Capnocytophaga leadbetteri]
MGQVGQVRQVGGLGRLRGLGELGQVGLVSVVLFSVFRSVVGRLYFANYSLIVRSSCIVPISDVKGKYKEKNFLLIGKFAN